MSHASPIDQDEAAPARGTTPLPPPQEAALKKTATTQSNPDRQRATAETAKLKLRHKLILLSFFIMVMLPTLLSAWYMIFHAEDQYISTVAFSVRKEEASPSLDFMGGITQLAGGATASDTDILYDFLRSEDIVSKVDKVIDLRSRFSKAWPGDPVFAMSPSKPIEQLARHWRRQVKVHYNTSTRLITLEVAAFTPEDAYEIAQATFKESSRTINRLSDIARDDATRFAREELIRVQERLTDTRQALTAYRMRTQIVDPLADLAGQMGVLNSLQAQLAEALISLDTLRANAQPSDQRVIQADQRIAAIRARIAEERSKIGSDRNGSSDNDNYALLLAEYEELAANMEFAETAYRSAQAVYDASVTEAQRQSRYLAAHIEPKPAEASIAPNRPRVIASVFAIMLLIWSIVLLIYYSIRDRR